jgi:pilus assembly protein Flp/PilA
MNLIARFVREDEGQDLIEYAILIGLITVATIGVVRSIGTWTFNQFNNLNSQLNSGS